MSVVSQNPVAPHEIAPLDLATTDFLGIELGKDPSAPDANRFFLRVRSLTDNPSYRRIGSEDRYTIGGRTMFDSASESSIAATSWFDRLLECRFDKNKDRYIAPTTDSTAIITLRSWGMGRIIFSSPEAKAEFERLVMEFSVGEDIALANARFRENRAVPPLPHVWQERTDARLADYQQTAVALSLMAPGFALFMDMGTGKTCCAIQRVNMLAKMLQAGEVEGGGLCPDGTRMLRVLVIVPKSLRLNWQREFQKFSHVPGKVGVLRGGLSRRIRKIAEILRPESGCAYGVLIAHYDAIRTTGDYLGLAPWDDCIIDESHSIKNASTERFKGLELLRSSTARRLAMTGSPIGNTPMDLWAQLEFLRRGGSGFTNRKAFKKFHGVYQKTGVQGVQKLIGVKNIPLLQERLARMSFTISKEDAGLKLPDKVRSVVETVMTPYQADVYRRLQDQLAAEIEDKLSGDVDEITVNNILTQLLRLAEVTSGFVTYNAKVDIEAGKVLVPQRKVQLSPGNPKTMALLELLQDPERDPKSKTIVWCQFIHNIEHLHAKLDELGIKHVVYYGGVSSENRDIAYDQFNNDPECRVFIGNPQTAGAGLNLLGYNMESPSTSDTYCNMEVFYSSGWSFLLRTQAEDRAHRRGTRMPVQIIDLVVPGSIDEDILNRVQQKREVADLVINIRQMLSSILHAKQEEVEVD